MNSSEKGKVQWRAVVSRFMNHRVNLKTGISSPVERTTATENVAHLCSMELTVETWVCRRLEDEMAGHLQTDLTAQFNYTMRTNSGMLNYYYYYYYYYHHHHYHHHHHHYHHHHHHHLLYAGYLHIYS